MKKFFISILSIAIMSTAFVSCSGDDDSSTDPTDDPVEVEKDGVIEGADDPDLDPEDLKGDVVADIRLTSDTEWTLSGALAVKEGFTLTIDPGTTIKAVAGGTNVYVVIEQGAKISAVGNANDPIRFTSAAGNPRSGDWGGILLNGRAKISGGGTATTEVLPLPYGGDNDSDSSGIMDYVILEYTGARINGEKEFNGLTLYGVGNGTQLSNIVISKGDDDSIEFFGGTVTVSNLLCVDARDDLFDWTQGWRSINGQKNTNWYGVRTIDFTAISEDPRGIEGDGNLDGNSPSDNNQSNPTIENITILNNGVIEFADLVKVRRGSAATITNLYLGFNQDNNPDADPSASDTVDLEDSKGNALASTVIAGTVNTDSGIDINDIKNAPGATITLTSGTSTTVDKSLFSWAGIDF